MEILFLSALASPTAIKEAGRLDKTFSSYAVQKFNRLIAEGLVQNGCDVTALSSFYLPNVGKTYRRRSEVVEGVKYKYITSPNYIPLRCVWLVIYCFFRVFFFGLFHRKNRVLVADVLNISSCIGAVAASRIVGIRTVGIVTDVPGILFGLNEKESSKTIVEKLQTRLNTSFLYCFSHYVFLTKQMKELINKKERPYVVMEGLVGNNTIVENVLSKNKKKVVIYAGGLMERYGLKLLVEGFIKANVDESELWIYGSGPFAEKIIEYNKSYPNVKYKGIRPNNEVVDAEKQASLLVNPRPTNEEFTKYSFPSKNLEYMVSGTPLLTTALPGMPSEYNSHVYFFDKGESVEGYAMSLKSVLYLSNDELMRKGHEAREWVLRYKNHICQTARIISLIETTNKK